MKMNAYIAGVGMTRFGKHLDISLKDRAGKAITQAVTDAGLSLVDIEAAYMGNAAAGVVQGQEMIAGQVALRELGGYGASTRKVQLCRRSFVDTVAGLGPMSLPRV
jgi:acetyl-CoA acetyltransferase